jgi:membrane protein DedA with SNARE-associated domain
VGGPLLDRYGKYVLIRKKELDRAHEWFEQYWDRAVFVSRLLPVVRTFISYPAEIVGMDVKKFSLYTVLGSFPWCLGLAYIGFLLGRIGRILKDYLFILMFWSLKASSGSLPTLFIIESGLCHIHAHHRVTVV